MGVGSRFVVPLVSVLAGGIAALPCPLLADDFQLNTYTLGEQSSPGVAGTPDGSLVCAWTSDGSWGSDSSSTSIQARRFGPDGAPLGPELQANSVTLGTQAGATVAAAPDGRSVVVWWSDVPNLLREVRAQRFGSDGNAAGPEIAVNTDTPLDQRNPSVSMDAAGGFVVAWQSGFELAFEVRARRFAPDGSPLGDEFAVNGNPAGSQENPRVAVQPGGGFVMAWQSDRSDGSDHWLDSVQARLYAPDGAARGPEFQVNTYTPGLQDMPDVGVDPESGGFVLAWISQLVDNQWDVAARRYQADGTPLGDEFPVNTIVPGSQGRGLVAVAPGGEFLVAWTNEPEPSAPPMDCSSCDVVARRFHADGAPYAPEFLVNSYATTGLQAATGVTVDAAGNFAVVWESEGSPGDDQDGKSVQGARQVAELQIANDDGVGTAVPGGTLTYSIVARHLTGLQSAVSVTVADAFPPSLDCVWTCAGSGGAACTPGPVAGDIHDPATLPVGSAVVYTAACGIASTATGSIANTASILRPPGLFDPTPADDSATDVDTLLGLVIDDVSVLEGNAGTAAASFTVTLASPLAIPVSVDFATADGTALVSDGDYLPASGTLLFSPGQTTKPLKVSVAGDTAFEADETFVVTLANPVGTAVARGVGVGTIRNDDSAAASGSLAELVHGSAETRSLETQPGPTPIAQVWRLEQAPNASYEVIVDAVTGDLGPDGPALDRVASDGTTLQSALGGSSRSLRFENRGGAVADERIRVQSRGCILDCDAADTFRIRLLETTLSGARFNNSATQVTVLIVQNASEQAVAGHVDFRDTAGLLLASDPLALGPRQVRVLDTSTLPALLGQAGSITISHDGPYGALAGKASAVEAVTGFSLDTPLEPRRP